MMHRAGFILALFLLGLSITRSNQSFAQDNDHLTFQQMAYGDWLIYPQDGEADGVFAVIMKAIAKDAGLSLSFENVPFKRTIHEVSRGKKVLTGYMVSPGNLDPSFDNMVTLTPMLEKVEYGVTLRKNINAKTLADLKGLHISFFHGASPEPGLTDNPDIAITLTRDLTQAIRMFRSKRIDGIWADYYGLDGAVAKLTDVTWDDMFGDRILTRTGVPAIVVHKDFARDPRVKSIKASAERLYQSGQLEKLARGWFSRPAR